jgi:hypothetical protein
VSLERPLAALHPVLLAVVFRFLPEL